MKTVDSNTNGVSAVIRLSLGEFIMLEKLILAAAITFSLNFFLGVSSQTTSQIDSEVYVGKTTTGTVIPLNSYDTVEIPLSTQSSGFLD